jgi:hypothetical protein
MKRTIAIAVTLAFFSTLWAAGTYVLNKDVELRGKITKIEYEITSGDPEPGEKKVKYYELVLDEPIDAVDETKLYKPELNVLEIQLAAQSNEQSEYLVKNTGRHAVVKGELYHRDNYSQKTEILMLCREIKTDKYSFDLYRLVYLMILLAVAVALYAAWSRSFGPKIRKNTAAAGTAPKTPGRKKQ